MGGHLTRLLIIGPCSQHPASEVSLHPFKSPRFGAARQGTGPRLPPRRRVPTSSQQLERLAVAEPVTLQPEQDAIDDLGLPSVHATWAGHLGVVWRDDAVLRNRHRWRGEALRAQYFGPWDGCDKLDLWTMLSVSDCCGCWCVCRCFRSGARSSLRWHWG